MKTRTEPTAASGTQAEENLLAIGVPPEWAHHAARFAQVQWAAGRFTSWEDWDSRLILGENGYEFVHYIGRDAHPGDVSVDELQRLVLKLEEVLLAIGLHGDVEFAYRFNYRWPQVDVMVTGCVTEELRLAACRTLDGIIRPIEVLMCGENGHGRNIQVQVSTDADFGVSTIVHLRARSPRLRSMKTAMSSDQLDEEPGRHDWRAGLLG
ncbi:hypothetical protein [Leifsonia sp. Leaf264]|uniref:hypothetical protein n=1 Tax=Leifsonia sp. Leaf264 TaxID=1736314 RepID=UPI0006F9D69E|nr:hypothetical protein [Leifsonia sp. Leaf264]KQP01420.1 hypothetical protein ASF30_02040 [Leifsonia sp. Leaf264]